MAFYKEVLRYEFGELSTTELPRIAVLGLEEGLDTRSLRMLAGCVGTKVAESEVLAIYSRTLSELKINIPSRREIAIYLIEDILMQIVNAQIHPYDGAKLVVPALLGEATKDEPAESFVGESLGLARLVGLRYSYDDVAEAFHRVDARRENYEVQREIENDIRHEAERLLSSDPWRR